LYQIDWKALGEYKPLPKLIITHASIVYNVVPVTHEPFCRSACIYQHFLL